MLREKYELILIDVGGRDTASLRAALTISDTLIVPVLPATFDIWSLEPLGDLIREAKEINAAMSVLVILNAADAKGRDNEEAGTIIHEKVGFEYSPHPIIRPKAFRNAAAAGLSVLECRPSDEKAINEFHSSGESCVRIHWRYRTYILCPSQNTLSERQRAKTSKRRHSFWPLLNLYPKPNRRAVLSRHRSGFQRVCWNGLIGQQKSEA